MSNVKMNQYGNFILRSIYKMYRFSLNYPKRISLSNKNVFKYQITIKSNKRVLSIYKLLNGSIKYQRNLE